MRDLEEVADTNEHAKLALDMFLNRVIRYLGQYTFEMGGVDAIVFTAGIGENDDYVREEVCKYLGYLGVDFDSEVNKGLRGKEAELTKKDQRLKYSLFLQTKSLQSPVRH